VAFVVDDLIVHFFKNLATMQYLGSAMGHTYHMLHDLIKADGVVLQAEIGEDDKAHPCDCELGGLLDVEPLRCVHADSCEQQKADESTDKVNKRECCCEGEALVEDELIGRHNTGGREEIECHHGGDFGWGGVCGGRNFEGDLREAWAGRVSEHFALRVVAGGHAVGGGGCCGGFARRTASLPRACNGRDACELCARRSSLAGLFV
jgi:hypothetical protein